ncbi:hypothetical protein VSH64_15960 [Amycolatopsis rhabdoformis]|uniref:DUF3618 domain-containing protein n=1 Tax=Amycolatopsis rhabdoformis TaxID=1448059 RepID=A0ABZ1IHF1_9PSEU|nr:hypothetical protein [Amycolatopsis rhabdoformis]WSE33583.1 hypothetical protein VSH64_15960 [Amycolatopsis rhabdoformis]
MSNPISDKAETTEARVDQLVARAKQKAARCRAMQQAVEQVSVSAAPKEAEYRHSRGTGIRGQGRAVRAERRVRGLPRVTWVDLQ